jgi:hypothetical protein
MAWESLTAIGTLISALVIAGTVVVATRQLKLTFVQLEHSRKSNDLLGAMSIFAKLEDPRFVDAYHFVVNDLERRLQDEAYRRELMDFGVSDERHKELVVLRTMENVGGYVRYGLIEGDIIYDCNYPEIVGCWEALREVVAAHRRAFGTNFWINYEFLYDAAKAWAQKEHGDRAGFLTLPRRSGAASLGVTKKPQYP